MKFKINSGGQVWIETVVYTLIGLSIMAILLSISMPQIEKIKDNGIITQTIEAMNLLNSKILEAEEYQGSIRIVNLRIAKGRLEINSTGNQIVYNLENTRLELTEPGEIVQEGNIMVETKNSGDRFNIFLTLDYSNDLNITYDRKKEMKTMQAGTTPYKIILENIGYDDLRKTKINFDVS